MRVDDVLTGLSHESEGVNVVFTDRRPTGLAYVQREINWDMRTA